jgi:L-fucose mutarotase/ribose pyranase (RbsD/FucU family)
MSTMDSITVDPLEGVHGSNDVSLEVQAAHDRILEAAKALAAEESAQYFIACERALHLVLLESNPVWMLQVEDGSAENAARRSSKYWDTRVKILQDRAFLPISDLTGNGALTQEDVDYMKQGTIVMLPKDAHGRSVICADGSQCKGLVLPTMLQRMRVMFYMFGYAAALNPVSQTETGVVVITIYHDAVVQDRSTVDQMANLIHFAFPARFKAAYACFLPPPGGNVLFKRTIAPVITEVLTW